MCEAALSKYSIRVKAAARRNNRLARAFYCDLPSVAAYGRFYAWPDPQAFCVLQLSIHYAFKSLRHGRCWFSNASNFDRIYLLHVGILRTYSKDLIDQLTKFAALYWNGNKTMYTKLQKDHYRVQHISCLLDSRDIEIQFNVQYEYDPPVAWHQLIFFL